MQNGEDARRGDLITLATARLRWRTIRCRCRNPGRGWSVMPWPIQSLYTYSADDALFLAADVTVHVDEAGQNVVTAQVDLAAAGFELRAACGSSLRAAGRARPMHVRRCDCLR